MGQLLANLDRPLHHIQDAQTHLLQQTDPAQAPQRMVQEIFCTIQ